MSNYIKPLVQHVGYIESRNTKNILFHWIMCSNKDPNADFDELNTMYIETVILHYFVGELNG